MAESGAHLLLPIRVQAAQRRLTREVQTVVSRSPTGKTKNLPHCTPPGNGYSPISRIRGKSRSSTRALPILTDFSRTTARKTTAIPSSTRSSRSLRH